MRRSRLSPEEAAALGLKKPEAPPAPRPAGLCAAFGCRLPGSLAEHSGSRNWWCAFHYSANPSDLQRITAVLLEHRVLVDVMLESRAFHADPAAVEKTAGARLLAARNAVAAAGYKIPARATNLRSFAFECETLLGGCVLKAMTRSKERTSP